MRNDDVAQDRPSIRTEIVGGFDERIVEAVERSGGLEYTAALAAREAEKAEAALAELPATPYRDALAGLARFAVNRTS